MTRSGNIYFEGRKVLVGELPKMLAAGVRNGSERRVYLLADQRAKYLDVELVLDAARDAGIKDVSFWAWKK